MQIHYNIDSLPKFRHAVVTTGTFDGAHLGHQVILKRLIEAAKESNGESVVFTFEPHPRLVLYPEQTDLRLLNTIDEKAELLAKSGIDHLIVYPFTKEFANISSLDFIHSFLIDKLNTKHLIIGYDHRFGKNREGSFEYIQQNKAQFGFEVEEIPVHLLDNINVSSSRIRKALELGDLPLAKSYLGYDYFLSGKVVSGKQLGRTIGFPTANISLPSIYKLIPHSGVYAIKASIKNEIFSGVCNIGTAPTVTNTLDIKIEAHLFNFDSSIYDQEIRIFLIEKIRDEKKFNSLDELKAQIKTDANLAESLLKHVDI